MDLPERLEELKEYYCYGNWTNDFLANYKEDKIFQALIPANKKLIQNGLIIPEVPDDCMMGHSPVVGVVCSTVFLQAI